MKSIFFLRIGIIFFLAVGVMNAFGQLEKERKMIVGAWSTEKGLIKFVFKSDMKCYQYHKGKPSHSYKYKISNSSRQCGETVNISKKQETSYLELTDLKNGIKSCFEINGIEGTTLSLTGMGSPGATVYTREASKK